MRQLDQGLVKAFHAGGHYENFPVASWLLPAAVRPAVVSIYRLARTGDDLADEGDLTINQRLAGLAALRRGLSDSQDQALTKKGYPAGQTRKAGQMRRFRNLKP